MINYIKVNVSTSDAKSLVKLFEKLAPRKAVLLVREQKLKFVLFDDENTGPFTVFDAGDAIFCETEGLFEIREIDRFIQTMKEAIRVAKKKGVVFRIIEDKWDLDGMVLLAYRNIELDISQEDGLPPWEPHTCVYYTKDTLYDRIKYVDEETGCTCLHLNPRELPNIIDKRTADAILGIVKGEDPGIGIGDEYIRVSIAGCEFYVPASNAKIDVIKDLHEKYWENIRNSMFRGVKVTWCGRTENDQEENE
jgi:hypothetical protein